MVRPVLQWPGVPTLCALAAVLVLGIDLLPRSVFDVTMSVEARTEVVELTLDPQREYVWGLPAGSYSLLVAKPLERPAKVKGPAADGERSTFEIRSTRDEL